MKRTVVFGALSLLAGFAACGSESKSLHRGGPTDAGEGGEVPGGQGPGGESVGGVSDTGGASGASPAGGRSLGGRGGSAGGGVSGVGGSGALGGVGGVSGSGGGAGVPCGPYDCTRLPHLKPGLAVECRNGVCILPPDPCEEGFAQCSENLNVGCQADLRSSATCGNCETSCSGATPACTLGTNGWRCASGCDEPTPDKCGFICTNLDTDAQNCGACRNACQNHAPGQCVAGECVRTGPCEPGFGDCTDANGCETELTTPEHCGACGRNGCGAENAEVECSSPSGCVPPTCVVGFGNCDRASPDCEAPAGTACFPTVLAPQLLASPPARVAIVDGGALFAVGSFTDTFDFDASSGVDVHTARGGEGTSDAYITRFDASGAYAWTRPLGGDFEDYLGAAGISRDGSFLTAGTFYGSADLDPGSGTDPHVADTSGSGFIVKLTATGDFVWARDLRGQVAVNLLAGDATGAVYANGVFFGTVDLDPGSATSLHAADKDGGTFLVKLDASGNFAWDVTIEGYGYREIMGLAVAADNSVWVTGRHSAQMSLGGSSLGDEGGMFVAGFEPSGTLRMLWSPGSPTFDADRPSIAAGTNVHVEGRFAQSLDVDPGSATVTRVSNPGYGTSGFTLGLGVNGAYQSAHAFRPEPLAIGAIPGGGSLVLLPLQSLTPSSSANLFAYYADGTSAWTLLAGTSLYPELAVSNTHFAVYGMESEPSALGPVAADERAVIIDYLPVVRRYAF